MRARNVEMALLGMLPTIVKQRSTQSLFSRSLLKVGSSRVNAIRPAFSCFGIGPQTRDAGHGFCGSMFHDTATFLQRPRQVEARFRTLSSPRSPKRAPLSPIVGCVELFRMLGRSPKSEGMPTSGLPSVRLEMQGHSIRPRQERRCRNTVEPLRFCFLLLLPCTTQSTFKGPPSAIKRPILYVIALQAMVQQCVDTTAESPDRA